MRWLFLLLFPALVSAQVPDSIRRDSVADTTVSWRFHTKTWYTRRDTVRVSNTVQIERLGRPFGVYDGFATTSSLRPNTAAFSMIHNGVTPDNILAYLATARRLGLMLRPALAGGAHSKYITDGKFDLAKWKAKMATFNTPAIKAAIAQAVADGVLLGNIMMDEPQSAKDATGPDWGGVMNKAVLDQMAAYGHSLFPTLPQGVTVRPDWHASERYTKLDFLYHQYAARFPNGQGGMINDPGNVDWWIDYSLKQCERDKVVCTFGVNIVDGGIQGATCPVPLTGGVGSRPGYCRATAAQIKTWGTALLLGGAGLTFWEHGGRPLMADSANQVVFNALGKVAKGLSRPTWKSPR